MTRVFVSGLGAVSPAGWGVNPLREALSRATPMPLVPLAHPGRVHPLPARPVPPPVPRPDFLGHARLRRTSPLAQYVVAAALEALAGGPPAARPDCPVGIIVCLTVGCVNYTKRFYEETLRDPASASPLVFPETVFNAPASHLAALLGSTLESCTLVGDEGTFLQGVALAGDWLDRRVADLVVVVGADELDWLVAGAMNRLERGAVHAAGAGAVCLRNSPPEGPSPAVALARITDAWSYTAKQTPELAARAMRRQLPAGTPAEWLVLSARGHRRLDAAEQAAWADWPGLRVTPQFLVGAAFNAGSAWQVVLACEAIRRGTAPAATVSVVGTNQQAIGARFTVASENVSSGSLP